MDGCLPIIEVTEHNFESMFPALKKSISDSFFIALDCELSGLGTRSKLNCPQVDIRYKNIVEIAQEYSIVSLGLSCFISQSVSSVEVEKEGKMEIVKSENYVVQTFNILTLCSNPYVVEGASMKFLASHGFDFNKQYTQGVPFTKASKQTQKNHSSNAILKDVFSWLLKSEKPLVLHNGFVDLMFLYDSFYAELPKKSETFAADLLEMFPAGVFDTKYIAEFHNSFPATFLEYIFKKLQLENEMRSSKGDWTVRLTFLPYPPSLLGLNWHPYDQIHCYEESESEEVELCDSYKFHGWCSRTSSCPKSHNINRIVNELCSGRKKRKTPGGALNGSVAHLIYLKKHKVEDSSDEGTTPRHRNRIRKRRSRKCPSESDESPSVGNSTPEDDSQSRNSSPINNGIIEQNSIPINGIKSRTNGINSRTSCNGHRAGFDAFMTGYIFSCILSQERDLFGDKFPNLFRENGNILTRFPFANRVYLGGKEFPFLISKSAYASQSKNHRNILDSIRLTEVK